MDHSEYLLDNAAHQTRQRFDALSAVFDGSTIRHFEAVGVQDGWRCWEVGAGSHSIPNWLSTRVGAAGRVWATDIDVSHLTGRTNDNVAVQHHDVSKNPPPGSDFDLVHARLVLSHVPDRASALARMTSSLRRGGWLLVEDFDIMQPLACVDAHLPEHHRANKLRAAFCALLAQQGADLKYARRLPRLFREAGLTNVRADAYFPVALPGASTLDIANISQLREAILVQALATTEEIDAHIIAATNEHLDLVTPPLISVWGQRI